LQGHGARWSLFAAKKNGARIMARAPSLFVDRQCRA
jgi:hypothetical protein